MPQTIYYSDLLRDYGEEEAALQAESLKNRGNIVVIDAESVLDREGENAQSILDHLSKSGYKLRVNYQTIKRESGDEADQVVKHLRDNYNWDVYDAKPQTREEVLGRDMISAHAPQSKENVASSQPTEPPPVPIEGGVRPGTTISGITPQNLVRTPGVLTNDLIVAQPQTDQQPVPEQMKEFTSPSIGTPEKLGRAEWDRIQKQIDNPNTPFIQKTVAAAMAPLRTAVAPFVAVNEEARRMQGELPGMSVGMLKSASLIPEGINAVTNPELVNNALTGTLNFYNELKRVNSIKGTIDFQDIQNASNMAVAPVLQLGGAILGLTPKFVSGAAMFELADGLIQQGIELVAGKSEEEKQGGVAPAWRRPLSGVLQGMSLAAEQVLRQIGFSPGVAESLGNLISIWAIRKSHDGVKALTRKIELKMFGQPVEITPEDARNIKYIHEQVKAATQ
jgi:hypothetical protein